MKKQTILIFGDTHFPYHHIDTFEFLQVVKDKYKPTDVICTGDLIDNMAINFHEKDTSAMSQEEELNYTTSCVEMLGDIFPKLEIVQGNHDKLPLRKANAIGLSSRFIKDNKEVFNMPNGWKWYNEILREMSDGRKLWVRHQFGVNLKKWARNYDMCMIQGHYHSMDGGVWEMNSKNNNFALTCGSLVDDESIAMKYNKFDKDRPILNCIIIQDGIPKYVYMEIEDGLWTGKL